MCTSTFLSVENALSVLDPVLGREIDSEYFFFKVSHDDAVILARDFIAAVITGLQLQISPMLTAHRLLINTKSVLASYQAKD